jgi:beta-lactam-binding protein with PASTA domain
MKSFFRLALRALILLVVALVSALTAMRFAIHGREVAVPNFLGKTPSEAHKLADDVGLQLTMDRQYFSDSVPEGRVMSQLPSPGAKVRRGWQVSLAESLGHQRVQIPNVVGESERAASMNIERRGLNIASVAQVALPGTAADDVLAQSPSANASGVAAPRIGLLVATEAPSPSFIMPSFTGQTLANAAQLLQSVGMKVGAVSVQTPPSEASAAPATPSTGSDPKVALIPPIQPAAAATPSSIIVSQNPSAGEKVAAGMSVNFIVR